jgi:hypothetical protein
MRCPSCGATIDRVAAFCSYCGGALPRQAPAGFAATSADRFAAAEAHPSYRAALHYQPPAPSSALTSIIVIGIVIGLLPLLAIPLMLGAAGAGGAILVLMILAIAGLGGFAIWRRRERTSSKPAEVQRELVVVLATHPTRATYNPLRLTVQRRDGGRFECYGLSAVAQRLVAPGDIGVAYFSRQPLMGLAMIDFIRVEA